MSFLFFPGTLIHELSHALMAGLLQVPVGRMEFVPKLVESNLKMGSVEVAKTDPIRRILIGTAPFLIGTLILVSTFFYAVQSNLLNNTLFVVVISYIVFEIGNTMFSSKRDMEGALEVVLAIVVICVVFYIVGFRLPSFNPELLFSNPVIKQTFQNASFYLSAPIGIDVMLITLLRFLKK